MLKSNLDIKTISDHDLAKIVLIYRLINLKPLFELAKKAMQELMLRKQMNQNTFDFQTWIDSELKKSK